MDFTDDEIREELARLGYHNVPSDKLSEFKKDLLKLIEAERTSKNNSFDSSIDERRGVDEYEGPELGRGNFTNHGSQWIDENLKEDWGYRGEPSRKDQYDRVKSSSSTHQRKGVPGSYALHELPIDVERENRHANDNKSNNTDQTAHNESGRVVKRKTCRTAPDGARRIDESFTESETEDILNIYQKIKSMAVRDCECGKSKGTSSDVEPPYRIKSGKKKIPSYIRKPLPPHTRNLKFTNPFSKMDKYERLWKMRPVPGEADRSAVAKKIHQKMLQKYEIKVDNKVYVPNNFTIPSDKPRTALRWKVRSALENYELPAHGYYHDI